MRPAPIRLTPEPLTAEAFAAYGQVLEIPAQAGRRDFAARLVNGRSGAKLNLALIRVEPAPLPLTIRTIERHPASSQTFVPLDGGRYLVVVIRQESDGGPDAAHAKAFIATEHQAINYDVGTWHVGITVLDRPTSFCMTIFEDGGPDDCHFRQLERPFVVETA
jgi:ureidoglycolate hydrolase